jgi:hypothetical protein
MSFVARRAKAGRKPLAEALFETDGAADLELGPPRSDRGAGQLLDGLGSLDSAGSLDGSGSVDGASP